jgi:hypothetical protein
LDDKLYTGHPDNYTDFEPMTWISIATTRTTFDNRKAIEFQSCADSGRVGPIRILGENQEGKAVVNILGRGETAEASCENSLDLDGESGESIACMRATIASPPGQSLTRPDDFLIQHGVMIGLEV